MTILNSTLSTGIVTSTSVFIGDKDPDKTIENSKSIIATSLVGSATTLGAQTVNNTKIKEMHNKYASAYVESMSDEQLIAALEKLNLLDANGTKNDSTKTI